MSPPLFGSSKKTRFDFLLTQNDKKCFLEVKNVTLKRTNNIAEFPDAITSRGTKHLNELIFAKEMNYDCYMLYLIQREDCKYLKIAEDIDSEYKVAFNHAKKLGIKMICYDCKMSLQEIKLNQKIDIIF